MAFTLTVQQPISVPFVRILVWANWLWTAVSVALLLTHVVAVTVFGLVFLVLQILVVRVEVRQLAQLFVSDRWCVNRSCIFNRF